MRGASPDASSVVHEHREQLGTRGSEADAGGVVHA
jgi:hypothetical protein